MSWIKNHKNLLINFTLLLASICLAILAAEFTLRLLLPKENQIMRSDPVISYVFLPNSSWGIDANGFRGFDQQSPGQPIIVTLGDSHTIGQLDDPGNAWPSFLADLTGQKTYNMGATGYGVAEYYYLLPQALAHQPKLIIIGFYLGNDIFNAYDIVYHKQSWDQFKNPQFVDEYPATTKSLESTKIFMKDLKDWLRNHLLSYKFLADRTRILREKLGLAKAKNIGVDDWSNNDPDVTLRYNEKAGIKTLFWPASRLRGVNYDDINIQEGYRLTKEFLLQIQEQANKESVNLLLALIPSKELAYLPEIDQLAQKNQYFKKVLVDESKIANGLMEFCQLNNINCMDMTSDLQVALQEGQKIYKETWDEHPTRVGYQAYAKSISDYLQQHPELLIKNLNPSE
ncbi:MAG: SGNH/GDSL hydrolase family protein [Candidatus Komeilibacteria bacterium]|nr:SGNH/GDSL hydrolase family protein [Candidatus Komeilibacteria bacterium]